MSLKSWNSRKVRMDEQLENNLLGHPVVYKQDAFVGWRHWQGLTGSPSEADTVKSIAYGSNFCTFALDTCAQMYDPCKFAEFL